MDELIKIWIKWIDGPLPKETVLWGQELWLWGRIAGFVSLSTFLFMLTDIIGVEKIRKFGVLFNAKPLIFAIGNFAKKVTNKLILILKKLFRSKEPLNSSQLEIKESHVTVSNYQTALLALFISSIVFIQIFQLTLDYFINSPLLPIVFYVILLIVSVIVVFILVLLSLTLIGILIDFFFLQPINWVLKLKYLSTLLKIINLILFLIASHFVILAL